jgi:hypothetical protein
MIKLKVSLEEDHTIHVDGGTSYVNIDLSPTDALALLQGLEANRTQITDLATNYYDCRECGYTHHKSVTVCPSLSDELKGENHEPLH